MKLLIIILIITGLPALIAAQQQREMTFSVPSAKERADVEGEFVLTISPKVVQNAPFSAQAITENVQILADGNQITRNETARIYRDAKGRVRREQMVSPGGGSIGLIFGIQETISIFDPTIGVQFLLNPTAKTARRTVVGVSDLQESKKTSGTKKGAGTIHFQKQVEIKANPLSSGISKIESLGDRRFEGLEAEGSVTTTIIPAGAIGNKKPIEVVYEQWYSKDLQQIIFSKNSDPRFGVQTYQLVEIKRNNPDSALFTVPTEYKVFNNTLTFEKNASPKN